MIQGGIVNYLLSDTILHGLIGGRIYPVIMPVNANTFPVIVYSTISASNAVNLDLTAVSFSRINFDCRGKSYADAKNVQARLHVLLDGYMGNLNDGTIVKFTESVSEIDLYDSQALIYRANTDFAFTH
jgi:hypothetical protein